jgi:energy-coupling factor transporter transmembrane protein EcfT
MMKNLHPLTSFAVMITLTVLSMFFTDYRYLAVLAAAAVVFYWLAQQRNQAGMLGQRRLQIFLMVGAIVLIAFNAVFANVNIQSRYVIFVIPFGTQPYEVTWDGVLFGVGAGLRYICMFLSLVAFLLGTVPRDFANALENVGVSITIANMFALTFRFLTTLEQLLHKHWEGQKSRGYISDRRNVAGMVVVYGTLLKNVFLSTIMLAPRYAMVLGMRGFGVRSKRSHYHQYELTKSNIVILGLLAVAIISAAYIRIVLKLGAFTPLH